MKVELVGAGRIRHRIASHIADGVYRHAPAKAGAALVDGVVFEFATEGQGSWSRSYQAELTGKGTLRDTGALLAAVVQAATVVRQSAYYLVPRGHGDGVTPNPRGEVHEASGVFRFNNSRIEVGVSASYAVKTQEGFVSRRYGTAIPARPFMVIRLETRRHIVANWLAWDGRSFAQLASRVP